MSDSTILNLTQAQSGYVDDDDFFVIQKTGETTAKKVAVSDVFGGWRDLLGSFTSAKAAGVNQPTWAAFGPSGGLYAWQFAVGDEVFLQMHIDHDMKQGATMYQHMHWSTSGTNTNTVKWEIEYTVAARESEPAFPAPTTVTLEAAPNGTAWSHYVTEDATGVSTLPIDSVMMIRVARVTNGATDNTDAVFGLTMDWHYPTDRYSTKNRAPDFYA